MASHDEHSSLVEAGCSPQETEGKQAVMDAIFTACDVNQTAEVHLDLVMDYIRKEMAHVNDTTRRDSLLNSLVDSTSPACILHSSTTAEDDVFEGLNGSMRGSNNNNNSAGSPVCLKCEQVHELRSLVSQSEELNAVLNAENDCLRKKLEMFEAKEDIRKKVEKKNKNLQESLDSAVADISSLKMHNLTLKTEETRLKRALEKIKKEKEALQEDLESKEHTCRELQEAMADEKQRVWRFSQREQHLQAMVNEHVEMVSNLRQSLQIVEQEKQELQNTLAAITDSSPGHTIHNMSLGDELDEANSFEPLFLNNRIPTTNMESHESLQVELEACEIEPLSSEEQQKSTPASDLISASTSDVSVNGAVSLNVTVSAADTMFNSSAHCSASITHSVVATDVQVQDRQCCVSGVGFKTQVAAFPSQLDSILEELGLVYTGQTGNESPSEQDIKNQFETVSLAMRTDCPPLEELLQQHERLKDQSVCNAEQEAIKVHVALHRLLILCSNSESTNVVTSIEDHMNYLMKAVEYICSNAETWGTIKQKVRMALAWGVAVSHTRNLELQLEHSRTEVENMRLMLSLGQYSTPRSHHAVDMPDRSIRRWTSKRKPVLHPYVIQSESAVKSEESSDMPEFQSPVTTYIEEEHNRSTLSRVGEAVNLTEEPFPLLVSSWRWLVKWAFTAWDNLGSLAYTVFRVAWRLLAVLLLLWIAWCIFMPDPRPYRSIPFSRLTWKELLDPFIQIRYYGPPPT